MKICPENYFFLIFLNFHWILCFLICGSPSLFHAAVDVDDADPTSKPQSSLLGLLPAITRACSRMFALRPLPAHVRPLMS